MGNELSTLGGAVVTAATAVAAGATLGHVQALNDAVVDSARFTAERAEETLVRHAGEAVAMAAATVSVSIASGVTLGQVQALNDAVVQCASKTTRAGERAGAGLLDIVDGVTDGLPGIGHVKGGVLRAMGDRERSDRALKSSSRSVSVLTGGVKGYLVGGPIGAVVGGVVCGAAMDGTITGVESALHREFRPHGQIACWDQVAHATRSDQRISGIVGSVMTPVVDALSGFVAGKAAYVLHRPRGADVAKLKNTAGDAPLHAASAFKRWTPFGRAHKATPSLEASDGLVKQALDGLGAAVAGGTTAEALYDTASTPEHKDALQQLWSDLLARVRDVVTPAEAARVDPVLDGTVPNEGVCIETRFSDAAASPLLAHIGSFKGKDLLVLLMVYIATSAMMRANSSS